MTFIACLSGVFKSYLIFTVIIIVHELGHFITGVVLGWKPDKIYIYPYGGCTKFNESLNKPLIEELLILIMGPITQITFYLLIKNLFNYDDYILFKNYNYVLLIFNLMPIYTLDGGRILNILLSYKIPYRKTISLCIYVSILVILFLLTKVDSLIFLVVILFLVSKLIEEYKNIGFYYNRFLLERRLKPTKYKKLKVIRNINGFYRDKKHVLRGNNKSYTEKEVLNKYFKL